MSGSSSTQLDYLLAAQRALATVGLAVLLLLVGNAADVEAQIFGERTLGRGLGRATTTRFGIATAPEGTSLLQQGFGINPREGAGFVGRDLRGRSTFVGSAQSSINQAPGAGSQQLSVQRSQDILRRRARNANLRQAQRNRGGAGVVYSPRLEIAFEYPPAASIASDRRIESTIASIWRRRKDKDFSVRVEQRHVILEGAVNSEYEKQLAEVAVRMEPEVDTVDNRLVVRGD